MNKRWEEKSLGTVCENLDSKRKPITQGNRVTGNIPYYGATGIVDYVKDYIFDEKLVLLGEDGAKWKSADECAFIIEGKTWVNNHAHVLRPNRKILIDEWLVYNLNFQDLTPFISGMTVPKLNQGRMNEIKIPIPPFPEQKYIIAILDEAFAAIDKAIANTEKNLQNAKELFESCRQNFITNPEVDWEEKKLGDIAFVKSGGTPSRSKKEYWQGNIAWYSSGELNNLYTKEPERHINEFAINNSNAKLFPKGSLLIGMYDTAALKMSIIDRDATFNQAIAGVKPNNNIDLTFILHSINTIKPDLLNLRRGVRQKNLSLEKIKNIPIFLPPLKVQQTVVKNLHDLSIKTTKLETINQQKLNDLEELKKSILQKAFTGELTAKTILEV